MAPARGARARACPFAAWSSTRSPRTRSKHAIENPRDLDRRLVDAQEARRILDRLYGYEVSPVLWKKVATGLSAGRVQSVATRIVVERERERIRFRSADYWDLEGTFEKPGADRVVRRDAGRASMVLGSRPAATSTRWALPAARSWCSTRPVRPRSRRSWPTRASRCGRSSTKPYRRAPPRRS